MKEIDLNEYFYYDETSPSYLRWKVGVWCYRFWKILPGDAAGWLTERGYYKVESNGITYLVHRVIWELFNGKVPEGVVLDHVDGDSKNNNIRNLRLVSQAENTRNRKMPCTNTSGKTGVFRETVCVDGNVYERYKAQWSESGKQKTKSFSVKKYGEKVAFDLASAFRDQMVLKLNLHGAGYTETHGTTRDALSDIASVGL